MMKLPTAILAFALTGAALAQTSPDKAAKPKNLVYNGGFEAFFQVDNLWDGVDSDNNLAGSRGSAFAITERGTVDNLAMPISVQVADMNNDGLLDLLTVDLDGYFRVYFNSGSKTEPKFTHAEIIPIYLSRFNWDYSTIHSIRHTLKAALFDLNRSGAQDLVIGNYGGEIYFLRNTGTAAVPDFRQPPSVDKIVVNTTKGGNLWGNLFAPAVYDWDRDGKPDVLVGEGSYSANAVHVLLNIGNGSSPKFAEESRFYAAYGDGREQLVPAIVDYNGDGNPDLIVGDRKGAICVYLADGPWKKEKELKFASEITFTSGKPVGGAAPAVGDLNGDGLFDIVVGKTNGRIGLAFNRGTKEQPKFDKMADIKGVDVWNRTTTRSPSDWTADFGKEKGNIYGYITVVKEEEDPEAAPIPEGKSAVKVSYLQPLNKIIKYSPLVVPPSTDPETAKITAPNAFFNPGAGWNWRPFPAVKAGFNTDPNMVIFRKVFDSSQIKPAVNYSFSFKAKGRSVRNGHWTLAYSAHAERSESKVTGRNDRGGVKLQRDRVAEQIIEQGDFNVSGNWGNVTRSLNLKFAKEKGFNDPSTFKSVAPPVYRAVLEIRATLNPGDSVFYLDDVELIEK